MFHAQATLSPVTQPLIFNLGTTRWSGMFHAQAIVSPVTQPPAHTHITTAMLWTKILLKAFLPAPVS